MIDVQSWKAWALTANGKRGTHKDLVERAKRHGLEVEADDDDPDLSFIGRPGQERFGLRVIGEIRGGSKAIVTITAKI
jgi:hypothetical protein